MKQFNVGDIVKIKKSVNCPFNVDGWQKGGRIGVVVYKLHDMTDLYPYIVFTSCGDKDKHTWVYNAEDLKLILSLEDVVMMAYGKEEVQHEDSSKD